MAKALVSMENDDEESHDYPMPLTAPEPPKYPWELRIALTDVTMKKLGIDPAEAMEGIGGLVQIHALARITDVSIRDSNHADGPCCRVELQIEDMAIDSEDDAEAEPKRGLALIYKK